MNDRKGGPPPPLRLHAADAEDLPAISAALSGATVKRGDMTWEKRGRRFALVCNRFRWEGEEVPESSGGSRIRSGVHFNDVQNVQAQGLNAVDQETVLELLSVVAEPGEEAPEAEVTLTFAGGPQIRLSVECIDVLVDDMGRAWYTPNRPRHETEDGAGD